MIYNNLMVKLPKQFYDELAKLANEHNITKEEYVKDIIFNTIIENYISKFNNSEIKSIKNGSSIPKEILDMKKNIGETFKLKEKLNFSNNLEIMDLKSEVSLSPYHRYITYANEIDFKLTPRQIEVIKSYVNGDNILVTKSRQIGFSSVVCFCIAVDVCTNPKNVYLLSSTMNISHENMNKIYDFIHKIFNLPYYCDVKSFERKVVNEIVIKYKTSIHQDSYIKSLSINKQIDWVGFKTKHNDLIVFDGVFDKYKKVREIIECNSGQSQIIIGDEPIYVKPNSLFKLLKNQNNKCFLLKDNKHLYMEWWSDPRYTQDLYFETDNCGVKFGQVKNNDEVKRVTNYIKLGYKPTSTWYKDVCREKYDNNIFRITKELNCKYLPIETIEEFIKLIEKAIPWSNPQIIDMPSLNSDLNLIEFKQKTPLIDPLTGQIDLTKRMYHNNDEQVFDLITDIMDTELFEMDIDINGYNIFYLAAIIAINLTYNHMNVYISNDPTSFKVDKLYELIKKYCKKIGNQNKYVLDYDDENSDSWSEDKYDIVITTNPKKEYNHRLKTDGKIINVIEKVDN